MNTVIRKGRPPGMKKEKRALVIVLLLLARENLNGNFILQFKTIQYILSVYLRINLYNIKNFSSKVTILSLIKNGARPGFP
jgi:hypothetical protein